MPLFPFAQFEVPGRLGIADGRYLARSDEGDDEDVLVISSLQAPRRERRRRSRRARDAGDPEGAESLPATRATIVRASAAFGDDGAAAEWLARMRRDSEARESFVAGALALLNLSLHAHRAATMDPYLAEVGPHAPSATRIGFGDGEELAAGEWSEALDAPRDAAPRARRTDALRPTERVAAVLGRRETVDACETLVLRARLDLDHGRAREAALQLGPGLRALMAEVDPGSNEEQSTDLTEARARLAQIERAGKQALSGELPAELANGVADTLALCERILRRRRILGSR